MSYKVIRWVKVQGMEQDESRTIRLGVAKDGDRTLFGVCDWTYPSLATEDVLSQMSCAVGDGFDPESVLERTRETGWFVFHAGSQLKVSATELEVAFYILRLINRLGVDTEEIRELVERRRTVSSPDPDQITVSAKDLEEVLEKYTKGQAAYEGDALYRLRGAVVRARPTR